jgi:serine/threonine protein kinase
MNNLLESRQEPIPGYRLIERLGHGGYGDVWKVEAPGGFMKAMKFVFGTVGDQNSVGADQELDALRRLVQIRHPFILSVERCDVVDGQVLITMELADRDLEDRFKECRADGLAGVPREELLSYMAEASEALDLLAKEYQLQHLDIKPTNLFLVRRHVKVGDFGLVRHLDGFETSIQTGLTPLYAPPESYDGLATLNSDQYSLALVYHEMLTGKRAIDGESARELMFRTVVNGADLSAVTEPERSILARALAKQPTERFPSCTAFIDALRGCTSRSSTRRGFVFDEETERDRLDRVKSKLLKLTPSAIAVDETHQESPSRRIPRKTRRVGTSDLAKSPRPEPHPEGTLQPTLVIGLGSFGVRMGECVRSALKVQFGEAAEKLPVQVLHIDVDPNVLRQTGGAERFVAEDSPVVLCRLRKGAEYRLDWDSSKHISSWLDQEQIFRIGPAGDTRGLRSLGRLAVVDNFEYVAQQILSQLSDLLSVETAEEVKHATGLRYRRIAPCVYVAAGMGGGTGSGMAIDVSYLVRALLERAGFPQPNVCLALAAGVDLSRDRDLQIANQFGLANDLAAFSNSDCVYTLPVKLDGLPTVLAGPPTRANLLFDVEAEQLAAPRDRTVLETFAEYVVQTATGGHDAFVVEGATAVEPFVGVGWFTLVHPYDRVLRAAGCDFAHRILDRWLVPLDPEETESRRKYAREFFEKNGYEPAKVAELLQQEAVTQAGKPIHAQAAERINQLIDALNSKAAMRNPQPFVLNARIDLRKMLGGDPVDDDMVQEGATPYETIYRKAGMVVSEALFQPIRRELESVVETVDHRFEMARGVWTGFADALSGLIKKLVESPKTKELECDAYDAAYDLHKHLVYGETPRILVETVERWVKSKLEHNGRLQLIALYQLLKSKIDELAVQVFTAPRKLEHAKQNLLAMRDQTLAAPLSLVRQPLFTGGSVTALEVLERFREEKGEADLDRLEETLRSDIFAKSGGIWETCSRPDIPAEVLAESVAAGAAAWLLQEMPVQDAAAVFLERNRNAPEQLQAELRSFLDWSAPSFGSHSSTGKKVDHRVTVLFPASQSGKALSKEVSELNDERIHRFEVHAGAEVHFVQTAASTSLGRIAPTWLLRGKPLFESHKYRGSVAVFPQTVDV